MINNKFLFFQTNDAFQKLLELGLIKYDSIAFIKDTGVIWTHGVSFGGIQSDEYKHVFITQERYDALTEYDEKTIYFIIEGPTSSWMFGNTFPIHFGNMWVFGGSFPINFT